MRDVRNVNGYVAPALTVDAVLLKGRVPREGPAEGGRAPWAKPRPAGCGGEVLLVRRARAPFAGEWALPGGFVDVGERTEDACRRELVEETGLRGDVVDLLGVYSDPARDPRGHTVTVAYVLKVSGIVDVAAGPQRGGAASGPVAPAPGDDAAEARWFPLDALPPLAFDHARIAEDARAWLARPGSVERLGDVDFGKCA